MTSINIEPKVLEIACDKELIERAEIYARSVHSRTKNLVDRSSRISWLRSILFEEPRNLSWEEAKKIVESDLWNQRHWIKEVRVLRHKAQISSGPILLDDTDYQLIKTNLEPM